MPANPPAILQQKVRGRDVAKMVDPDNKMPIFFQPEQIWQKSAFCYAEQPYNTPVHLSSLAQCLAG